MCACTCCLRELVEWRIALLVLCRMTDAIMMYGKSCGMVTIKISMTPDVNCSLNLIKDLVGFVIILLDYVGPGAVGLPCVEFRTYMEEFTKGEESVKLGDVRHWRVLVQSVKSAVVGCSCRNLIPL